jgi:hypothetical protein
MLNSRGFGTGRTSLKGLLNKWRTGREGPCPASKGRHDETQHNGKVFCWKRGAVFGISWSDGSLPACKCGGFRACQGPCLGRVTWLGVLGNGLKRRRKPPVSAAIFPETCVVLQNDIDIVEDECEASGPSKSTVSVQ